MIRRAAWLNLLVLLSGLIWAGASARAASAHALLVRSLPVANARLVQSPERIELWFTETLEPAFSRARLIDSAGQQVVTAAASVDPADETHLTLALDPLGPGIYTVAWQTLSKADGHEFSGAFPFTLVNLDGSAPDGATATGAVRGELPTAGELVARYLLLMGGMLLFGTALFQTVILPAPSQGDTHQVEVTARDQGMAMVWLAIAALTLGHGLHLVLQVLDLGSLDRLPDLLTGTRAGSLLLARQELALSALVVLLQLPQPHVLRHTGKTLSIALTALVAGLALLLMAVMAEGDLLTTLPAVALAYLSLGWVAWQRGALAAALRRRVWGFAGVLGTYLLLDVSLASHAGAGNGSVWAVSADFVHLAAASAWVGGLLPLSVLLWRHMRLPEAERAPDQRTLFALVQRFSYMAGFCVFVLGVTGLFNSLVQLPDLSLLWLSTYGRVLMLKLALLTAVMGVAFLNNRLVHAAKTPAQINGAAMGTLGGHVKLEVGLVLILVLSVAVLVQTPTPRDAALTNTAQMAGQDNNQVLRADDLSLHVQISPNQVGKSRFWVHVYHEDGSPVGEVQLVQLRLHYLDLSIGQAKADLVPLGGDTYALEGAYLSQAGAWNLSFYIRRRDQNDTLASFRLDVPRPLFRAVTSDPWQNPTSAIQPIWLVLSLLVAFAAIPVLWRRALQPVRARFKLLLWGGVLCASAGVGVLLLISAGSGFFGHSLGADSGLSVERAKAIYDEHCSACHGPTGRGDGPAAGGLNPPPANLQVHLAGQAHSDDQIFAWVTNGIPKTAMPAFGAVLTKDERRQVIAYIRSLASKSAPR